MSALTFAWTVWAWFALAGAAVLIFAGAAEPLLASAFFVGPLAIVTTADRLDRRPD